MRILQPKCIWFLASVLVTAGLIGCGVSQTISTSTDDVEFSLTPEEFEIVGASRASTKRFQILFFGFGPKNSYVKAERIAYEETGADLLVTRVRVKSFQGLMIPGFWLAWFGVENPQDFPLIGTEVYTTSGTGVKLPAWHKPEETNRRPNDE